MMKRQISACFEHQISAAGLFELLKLNYCGGTTTTKKKRFEFFSSSSRKKHAQKTKTIEIMARRKCKFVDDEAEAGDSPSSPASPSYLPASPPPPPLEIEFTLSERDHFNNLLHFIADNFDQHVVDLLSVKPNLVNLVDSGHESALYHALKEKYTSERIIYALIRAGPPIHIQKY